MTERRDNKFAIAAFSLDALDLAEIIDLIIALANEIPGTGMDSTAQRDVRRLSALTRVGATLAEDLSERIDKVHEAFP